MEQDVTHDVLGWGRLQPRRKWWFEVREWRTRGRTWGRLGALLAVLVLPKLERFRRRQALVSSSRTLALHQRERQKPGSTPSTSFQPWTVRSHLTCERAQRKAARYDSERPAHGMTHASPLVASFLLMKTAH